MGKKESPQFRIEQELRGLSTLLYLSEQSGDPRLEPAASFLRGRMMSLISDPGNGIVNDTIVTNIGPLPFESLRRVLPPGHTLTPYLDIIQSLESYRHLPYEDAVRSFDHIFIFLGQSSSGKGTVSDTLTNRFGFGGMALSDIIRSVVAVRGLHRFDPPALRDQADALRDTFGSSVLLRLVLEEFRLKEIRHAVFDGLRTSTELKGLTGKPNVRLVWVEATPDKRLELMKLRKREGDPQTAADLAALDARTFPEAPELRSRCSHTITNSGTRDELETQVIRLMENYHIRQAITVGS